MPDYVVGFLRESATDRILLLRKQKPAWQVGLLNGAGGKIEIVKSSVLEGGETIHLAEAPIDAMRREWREEIGFKFDDWRLIAVLADPAETPRRTPTVYVFAGEIRFFPDLPRATDVGEAIECHRLDTLATRRDVLKSNKWLLPLAFEDPTAPVLGVLSANGQVTA